jgi:hypothetical protein
MQKMLEKGQRENYVGIKKSILYIRHMYHCNEILILVMNNIHYSCIILFLVYKKFQ